MSTPVNNGDKIFTLLVEMSSRTGLPTGRLKPNIPADPNYIAPTVDLITCPLPGPIVIPTIDVAVAIGVGYSIEFKLLYGTSEIARSTAGTWTVPDRIYDGIIFSVTTAPQGYTVQITYNSGQIKTVDGVGVANIFVAGPFDQITNISIVSNVGDFNEDWNPDYLI